MRKGIFLSVGALSLAAMVGCSDSEAAKLSQEDLGDVPLIEQVNAVIDNADVIDNYAVIVEDKSIAIQYEMGDMTDNFLVLEDKKKGFPNVAMILADQLSVVDYDELVIGAYKDQDAENITIVSASFAEDEVDFDRWKDVRDDSPENFYNRYVDGYIIRGMAWDKLTEDTKDVIKSDSKGSDNTDFVDYYGSIVDPE